MILLAVIIIRLYQIQIIYSENYQSYLQNTSSITLQKNVPRGIIYDRNMEVLVNNEAVNTIIYQSSNSETPEEKRNVAKALAHLIEFDTSGLKLRDLKDLYLTTYPDKAMELISNEDIKRLDDNDLYQLQLNRIEDRHLIELSDYDKCVQVIFNQMNQGTNLTSNIIKMGATNKEIAIVSENLTLLPGVNIGVDWHRIYPSSMGESSIFGRVSSYESGLPASSANEYLTYGYQLNDRVGTSQLESCYESLLSGYKSQYLFTTENGNSTYEEFYQGQSGFSLSLTIDNQLQAKVDEIIEKQLIETKQEDGTAKYLQEAYVVMLDPNTGELLSINGKTIEDNRLKKKYEIKDNALGTFQNAFTVGSIVKGATLLAGYENKATSIGELRHDRPLIFVDGSKKSSWRDLGTVDDTMALMYSSNVYFMLQTILMAGGTTPRSNYVNLSNLDLNVFSTYRSFFSQFGLGVSTGIDLPNESIGLKETTESEAKLLDYAIGQADTYTTMQMAQYVSTIAANGDRFATQLVRDVYFPSNDEESRQLVYSFSPKLLNRVMMDEKYFKQVQKGFEMVLQDWRGTGYAVFNGAGFNPAGKTGTAQEFARDREGNLIKDSSGNYVTVHNTTFVGYAPANKPEVAIAVILPQAELPDHANYSAQKIGRAALQAYFDIQKENKY